MSIVPIGLFAAGLLALHWKAQEHERERSQIQTVHLLAAAVDNAIESTVQRATIFARLWAASNASDAAIYAQARQALAANADWNNILAFRADGSAVFRAHEPFGSNTTPLRMTSIFQPVVAERRPVVTDIFTSPTRQHKVIAVGVPVVRAGRVTHVLLVNLELRWFDQLLVRQGLPEGGVSGIFDRNAKFVARSVQGDEYRGADPTPKLVADIQRTPEGTGKYSNLNGRTVYTAWAPTHHGWSVAFATPSAPVDALLWNSLMVFGLLWLAVVLVGVAYAFSKGRSIAASLVSLENQARDLADGRSLTGLIGSPVKEVDQALAALEKASRRLQAATAERDRSFETEREARAAAEAANRAKDEFLAMLGHELRNPLAAISYAATIVGNPHHTREQLDFAAAAITRQTQHLKRLIDDLLDVGRVMTGKILLERGPLELAACVRQAVGMLAGSGRLAERNLQLDASPVWIHGDATRIEQIIGNLLVNAATYSSPGGHIRVRVAREHDDAVLEVSDDGRGIPAEALPHVFELFYQAEATVDRATGGLGIGLTLVQRLVALHGGSVSARSAGKDQGATFTVRMPAVAALAAPAQDGAQPRAKAVKTILVVEDITDERESLRIALELEGHRVLQAGDGPAALALLRSHRPRIAIVDIGLPGMSGHELAPLLRAQLGPDALLVAMTGYGGADEERRARQAGFDRHLTKPVNVKDLVRELDAALAGSRLPAAPQRAA